MCLLLFFSLSFYVSSLFVNVTLYLCGCVNQACLILFYYMRCIFRGSNDKLRGQARHYILSDFIRKKKKKMHLYLSFRGNNDIELKKVKQQYLSLILRRNT